MKVAIIGLGSVGAAVATAIKNTGLVHEMVLFDRDGVRSQAAAMDLGHASAFSFAPAAIITISEPLISR